LNFVLIPAAARMAPKERDAYLSRVFPSVFRLASWLAGTAALTGIFLFIVKFKHDYSSLFASAQNRLFLIGTVLGGILITFHFFLDPRLEKVLHSGAGLGTNDGLERAWKFLRIVPRVGLGVLTFILFAMMVGARGF
jgi:hypothetical protein